MNTMHTQLQLQQIQLQLQLNKLVLIKNKYAIFFAYVKAKRLFWGC
jgi:hypothetical protein